MLKVYRPIIRVKTGSKAWISEFRNGIHCKKTRKQHVVIEEITKYPRFLIRNINEVGAITAVIKPIIKMMK
jgi:hypothetical protein